MVKRAIAWPALWAAIAPKLGLAGKIAGGTALAAPAATYAINRWKGYDPKKALQPTPEEEEDELINIILPRLLRPPYHQAQSSVNPLLQAAQGLREYRARGQ
jgi:hypothetical protein